MSVNKNKNIKKLKLEILQKSMRKLHKIEQKKVLK